jgi:hypothetical protein
MKTFIAVTALTLLAGCSSMGDMFGGGSGSGASASASAERGPLTSEAWSPRTEVFTQRTFNPRDPYHGG